MTGSRCRGHQETRDKVRRSGIHVFAWLATVAPGSAPDRHLVRAARDARRGHRRGDAQPAAVPVVRAAGRGGLARLPGARGAGDDDVRSAGSTKKGGNLVYGSRYARAMIGTWWREGCRAGGRDAPALRQTLCGMATDRIRATWPHGSGLPGLARRGSALVRLAMAVAFPPAFVYQRRAHLPDVVDHLVTSPTDRGLRLLPAGALGSPTSSLLLVVDAPVSGWSPRSPLYPPSPQRWGASGWRRWRPRRCCSTPCSCSSSTRCSATSCSTRSSWSPSRRWPGGRSPAPAARRWPGCSSGSPRWCGCSGSRPARRGLFCWSPRPAGSG